MKYKKFLRVKLVKIVLGIKGTLGKNFWEQGNLQN